MSVHRSYKCLSTIQITVFFEFTLTSLHSSGLNVNGLKKASFKAADGCNTIITELNQIRF